MATRAHSENQRRRAIQLRELLTQLGPAYIKIGQALSTRPDLVPPHTQELTQLQDQLPPFPTELTSSLKKNLVIAQTNLRRTIAAANCSRLPRCVREAKTGETVAVKFSSARTYESITIDLYVLRQLAAWANKNIKRVRSDLVAILDEFGGRRRDGLHSGRRNAERFAQLYGHLQDVYIPKIYWQYTSVVS